MVTMDFWRLVVSLLGLLLQISYAQSNESSSVSRKILPNVFAPTPAFENVNLVRTINLERIYPRESVNVVIRNIAKETQEYYYIPFEADTISRVGGLEVRDRKQPDAPPFAVNQVEQDPSSTTQFYRVTLPKSLGPNEEQTLAITFHTIAAVTPLPAKIAQNDKQYLQYSFSAYAPSAYKTLKQKTKLRFASRDVPDYTKLPSPSTENVSSDNKEDPVTEDNGKSFVYGPFSNVPAGAVESVSVRYEFTFPLTHVELVERDVEVSHWGGNLAMEERYELSNRGAELESQFSRVLWQQQAYYPTPSASAALKNLWIPLVPGSVNAYFVDDIGNVSTSKFIPSPPKVKGKGIGKTDTPATLDIKPRYPVFGGWRYKFKIGWDRDLDGSVRKLKDGDKYVFRAPFLEGPKERQGVEYEKVVSRIILPEGAKNVQYETSVPLVSAEISIHRTFMDTEGRTTLTLTAINLNDEVRNQDVILTYDYPSTAMLKKPLTILIAIFTAFTVAWLSGKVDTRIAGTKA